MNRKHIRQQSTLQSSNVQTEYQQPATRNAWSGLNDVAVAGWASTIRLATLLLVKQGIAGVVVFLVVRR